MAVHFSAGELAGRRAQAAAAMARRGLDGMLLFQQESMYYLTGYDTFGYCFFQCLYLGADGTMTLLTRTPDLRQARHTSVIEDIRVWIDGAGRNPAEDLKAVLDSHGLKGKKLGIEFDTQGLTAANWRRVEAALDGFVTLEDASDLVNDIRVLKSPAELEYVRRAAVLADRALAAAVELARPGVFDGDILAAMQGEVFKGGGDYPANEFIIASGEDALLCRYFSGRRHLGAQDQLTLEFAGAYRRYHACLMRTLLIGKASPEHRAMHAACAESLQAAMEALRPGRPVGEVFDAHARVLDGAGYQPHRLNACGYSLGARFAPSWMDPPMFYRGNDWVLEANMVMFAHMILMNSDDGRAMCLGRTYLIGPDGPEPLSGAVLDLVTK